MNLKEKVEDLYVALVGNKLTLAGNTIGFAGLYGAQTNLAAVTALIGFGVSAVTSCGIATVEYYRRTEDLIKRRGRLDPRTVELWIEHTTLNGAVLGYCQQQGIYLAAKKYDQLETFTKVREKCSKVKIPHF